MDIISFLLPPKELDKINLFIDEEEKIKKLKAWKLLTPAAKKIKSFLYKRKEESFNCEIVGYVDELAVVIEFSNGQQHCIHPAWLKDMQAKSFSERGQVIEE